MSTKHTASMKAFQNKHNLSFQNFFTFTNPKIEKNNKIEEIPTACLMLMNTPKACPAAGSCRSVCLITSGNKIYFENKMKRSGIAGIFAASLELTKEGAILISQKKDINKLMIKKS